VPQTSWICQSHDQRYCPRRETRTPCSARTDCQPRACLLCAIWVDWGYKPNRTGRYPAPADQEPPI